jgi:glycosyltransferase involved in cell wall biosynthesis
MNIQIVMPGVNEEKRIHKVLTELDKANYKVVFVDDGSSDRTKSIIVNSKFKNVKILEHKINLGKGAALKTGCEYAFSHGADAVILMDSDGQHSIDNLPKFVETLETQKFDVVFGSRNLGLGMPFIRYAGNKVASVIVNLMFGIYVSDLVSGYRALTKNAYEKAKWSPSRPPGYGVETEMIIRIKKANLKYCEIPVATIYYDNYKGVSILDAFGVLFSLVYWKFKI